MSHQCWLEGPARQATAAVRPWRWGPGGQHRRPVGVGRGDEAAHGCCQAGSARPAGL